MKAMKQLECDIAIVAAGPAGLAAAISAAEVGMGVRVFEKSNVTGGAGNMGMGPLGIGSRFQRKNLIFFDKDQAFKRFMDYTHWRVDAKLVRAYLSRSGETIDWLEDMGVRFASAQRFFEGSEQTWHIVQPSSGKPGPRAASTMYKIMQERAAELGVVFHLETPVTEIIKDDVGGCITGLKARTSDGEEILCECDAVIVATGGFGDNPEMLEQYLGYHWGEDLFSYRVPGVQGDGMKMAWAVGAGKSDMNLEMIYKMPNTADACPDVSRVLMQPNLMVNLQGERFIDESIMGNTTYTGNAIAQQKDRKAFVIIDSTIKDHYVEHGLDNVSMVHPTFDCDHFDEQFATQLAQGNPDLFYGESLEELAANAGIDCSVLAATVEEYNCSCRDGYDELMNKPHKFLRPLEKGPFYAGCFRPSAYGSLGGIKINHKTEAVTDDWTPIPGLYAAGTDACSIFGDSYVFIMPGNTMGFCINSGRIAGENAAKYILGLEKDCDNSLS